MKTKFRYLAVADAIRREILGGTYSAGDRLPRQHDLAKEHGVAFNTLKNALDQLSREGYIVRRVGDGTFAALPGSRPPSALVVDDEAPVRALLTRALEASDWKAEAVDSGKGALAALADKSFDLIFLDLKMAGMNGVQAFQRIRRKDVSAQVVIVTGFPDSRMMEETLKSGPFAIMLKPFEMGRLHAILDERRPRAA